MLPRKTLPGDTASQPLTLDEKGDTKANPLILDENGRRVTRLTRSPVLQRTTNANGPRVEPARTGPRIVGRGPPSAIRQDIVWRGAPSILLARDEANRRATAAAGGSNQNRARRAPQAEETRPRRLSRAQPQPQPGPTALDPESLYLTADRPPEWKDVKEHHECDICRGVKSHPVCYECGHSHCYVCIRVWFSKNKTCPDCNAAIRTMPHRHWGEENGIRADYPGWIDKSVVDYSFEGLGFAVPVPPAEA
ncbi:hypothetical protein DFH06DRAFT_1326233 [Mycena polygramma]|nr:hypothetical protein DFH06DRAFT_1326233 [Mycena polygramma]